MYITAETLDDLMIRVLEILLRTRKRVDATRGGTTEVTGVLLKISNPLARLSRTETKGHIFSCLGELLWYLSKDNKLSFIVYYIKKYKDESEDGKTVYGGYGPRLYAARGHDQIANVLALLKQNPNSRRAVIQLFNAEDIAKRQVEIPCTCTLQFLIRKDKLHMFTSMRSNDAFKGLPHDVFAFTMLQELMARSLGVELGTYKHAVGSLHLYDDDAERARRYVNEGFQESIAMPPMPVGDPEESVAALLAAESAIRKGKPLTQRVQRLHPYWADLVRLLQIYQLSLKGKRNEIARIKRKMTSPIFNPYILRREKAKSTTPKPEQMAMPFANGLGAMNGEKD